MSSYPCKQGVDYATALAQCQAVSMRLCTDAEVADGAGLKGCGHDVRHVWTSTSYAFHARQPDETAERAKCSLAKACLRQQPQAQSTAININVRMECPLHAGHGHRQKGWW